MAFVSSPRRIAVRMRWHKLKLILLISCCWISTCQTLKGLMQYTSYERPFLSFQLFYYRQRWMMIYFSVQYWREYLATSPKILPRLISSGYWKDIGEVNWLCYLLSLHVR